MPDRAIRAFDARIGGRVQGVGFRWSAVQEAKDLGLCGWVRNEDDGSVSVHAEGAPESLEAFAQWLREGPPGARVLDFSLVSTTASGWYPGFTVEH